MPKILCVEKQEQLYMRATIIPQLVFAGVAGAISALISGKILLVALLIINFFIAQLFINLYQTCKFTDQKTNLQRNKIIFMYSCHIQTAGVFCSRIMVFADSWFWNLNLGLAAGIIGGLLALKLASKYKKITVYPFL